MNYLWGEGIQINLIESGRLSLRGDKDKRVQYTDFLEFSLEPDNYDFNQNWYKSFLGEQN
jgi:hypothetical protein